MSVAIGTPWIVRRHKHPRHLSQKAATESVIRLRAGSDTSPIPKERDSIVADYRPILGEGSILETHPISNALACEVLDEASAAPRRP